MPLTPGTRVGVYEIVASIGVGGMGEVFRATDTTLGRQVALKVLPDAFASDPERMARFEREAKTLASLNHPNIAAIYSVEKSAGLHALVMELVEGDDLSQRIARGAIPLDEALPIARQIADALEAAHEQGIIHRDLKPANIKVRDDGTVKVLDFGLAKALDPAGAANVSAMNSPTLTAHGTRMGLILGTAAYMSPEQARGKVVDRRADIWAFGVVLWEILTGQRLFKGEELSDVLAAVLRQDIAWTALPAATPPPLRRLLERCLDRDAKTRLRDIGEARVAIQRWLANPAADTATSSSDRGRASRRGMVALIIAGTAIVCAAVLAVVHFRETPSEIRLLTASLLPPEGTAFDFPAMETFAALSPDGRGVVFGARSSDGKSQQLWLRWFDSRVPQAQPLPGTEGGYLPFWSPDNSYVGFAVGSQLRKISVSGGLPSVVANLTGRMHGASWSRTGVIVCGVAGGILVSVSDKGGTPYRSHFMKRAQAPSPGSCQTAIIFSTSQAARSRWWTWWYETSTNPISGAKSSRRRVRTPCTRMARSST